jgi:hypothetical protein
MGDSSFTKSIIDVYPAAANSQTKYGPNDRLLIQFGNFPRQFIDWSKSFLKFDLQTKTADGAKTCRVANGLPIFQRVVTRIGGKVIEDLESYHVYEKLMNNATRTITDKNFTGLLGEFGNTAHATVAASHKNKYAYIKQLYSGVCNKDYLFPIHALNSGNALEFEMTLSPSNECIVDTSADTGPTYEISNVRFQLCLLRVSDDFFERFNGATGQTDLVLPMTLHRRHVHHISGGEANPVLMIQEPSKSLSKTMTVFRKPAVVSTVATSHQPLFAKSMADSEKLVSYQMRYGSRSFPASPLESTDHHVYLATTLTSLDVDPSGNLPAIASNYTTQDGFCIVGDYEYDPQIVSGLNTAASSLPLTMELKFSANAEPITAETFTETFGEIVIDGNGNVNLSSR